MSPTAAATASAAPVAAPAPSASAHTTSYPSLDLGLATLSKRTVHLVDLDVHVYGLDEINGSALPIGAVVRTRT
jgi:hypothetical protein